MKAMWRNHTAKLEAVCSTASTQLPCIFDMSRGGWKSDKYSCKQAQDVGWWWNTRNQVDMSSSWTGGCIRQVSGWGKNVSLSTGAITISGHISSLANIPKHTATPHDRIRSHCCMIASGPTLVHHFPYLYLRVFRLYFLDLCTDRPSKVEVAEYLGWPRRWPMIVVGEPNSQHFFIDGCSLCELC